MPQVLCRWHISKNIQSKAADAFKISSLDTEEERAHKEKQRKAFLGFWSVVVNSKSTSQLNENWDKLIADVKEYPRLSNYLKSEWWPYKKEFVSCYIDMELHFGARYV